MKKPSKEELDFLLEGSSLTSLGRDFSYGAFDRKPLGPCPVTLPHCLSAAISSIGTQRQTYLNNFIGQSALMYLMEGYDSPVRYYVTWVFEGTVARPVASDKDGVTTSKGKFRPFVLAYYKGRIAFRDVYPKAHLEMEAKKDNPVFRLEGDVWVSDVRREAVAHLGIDYEVCSSESLGKCILASRP